MKVKVKGYLTFKDSIGERVLNLGDVDKFTLRELLVRLSLEHEVGDSLYHINVGATDRRVVVLVNGRHHSQLPDRLDTVLNDEDEVAIFPPLVGGAGIHAKSFPPACKASATKSMR